MEDTRVFVLEIGTEEIPPADVNSAIQQLRSTMVQSLEKQRLNHGAVTVYGTPRRLVVLVDMLSSKQTENEVEFRGPPAAKAFDSEGIPTKAAEGFCRRYSVPLESMYRKLDGKVEYVYVRVKESSRSSIEVLAEDLPVVISSISFPKSMRWNSEVMFSRPVRWILALHGDEAVPFSFAGIHSGMQTCGLRHSSTANFKVESAEAYLDSMKKAGITIDVEDRKKAVRQTAISLAGKVSGTPIIEKNILDEVANLVEAPVPILGKFDESFLSLPMDLLVMVMQKHQKYFAIVEKSSGKLLPYFIAVANGFIDETIVRKGNEAVLRARYEDARFFYNLDIQKEFSEFREHLKGILFHEKLGTMLDKVMRIQKSVSKLSVEMGIIEDSLPVINEAASLAMSDLATAVVTEFTSLSGIMGRHYALRDGYSEQTANALFEITLPRFSGDMLPKSDAGIVLAIADRLDSLTGLFGVGCQPSSSNDPFGLRRLSYGLVQVLVENDKNLDLRSAFKLAAGFLPITVDDNVLDSVLQFVTRRLEQLLVDKGVGAEVVRSVLCERANWPCLAARSAMKMHALSSGDVMPKVVEAYSRPTRIIRGKDIDFQAEVNKDTFETAEEKALWGVFLEVKAKIHNGVEVDDFIEASSALVQPLEDLFNNVFVMVEDEQVRKNRLTLLKQIADLPKGIADLSFLPGF